MFVSSLCSRRSYARLHPAAVAAAAAEVRTSAAKDVRAGLKQYGHQNSTLNNNSKNNKSSNYYYNNNDFITLPSVMTLTPRTFIQRSCFPKKYTMSRDVIKEPHVKPEMVSRDDCKDRHMLYSQPKCVT